MTRATTSHLGHRLLLALAPLLLLLEIPGAIELWSRPDTGLTMRDTEIVSVSPLGPAAATGVEPGDVLIALDGRPTPNYASFQAAFFGRSAGDVVTLTLRSGAQTHTARIRLAERSVRRRLRDFLATTIGLLFLFLGFVTYLRREDALGRLFFGICLLFALLLLDLPTFPSPWVMQVESVLRNVAGLLLPAVFLRFFLIFPEGAGTVGKPMHRWLLAPPLGLAVWHLWIDMRGLPPDSPTVKTAGLVTALLFAVYIVAAIAVFDRKVRRENRWVLWNKLRVALLGMVLGILPITLATVARQIWPSSPVPLEDFSLLLLLLVPLSFSVALLRTGTIDLAYLGRQTLVAVALALPVGVITAILLLLPGPRMEGSERGLVYLLIVVLIFALSLGAVPARRKVAALVDRIFYPGQVELRRRAGRLAVEMNRARTPEELASFLCSSVTDLLHARSGSFYLLENETLRLLAHCEETQHLPPPSTLSSRSSLLAAALRRRTPILVEPELTGPRPLHLDPASRHLVGSTDVTVIAPLWGRDRPLAVFMIGPALGDSLYSEVALHHFRILINQAGSTLENAMLHQEDLARERVAAEMDLAREIQGQLLPHHPLDDVNFTLNGAMIPCREVGGDVFDYFELPDHRILFAVADASGKGVPASLLMSSLRAALRETARPSMSAAEIAVHLNRQVYSMTAEHHFIACFLGILQPKTGILDYCTAGIDPPLWWRKSHRRVERLVRGGPVLGALRDSRYTDGWIRLGPGDVIAAYSDGVVDEENAREESFGLARLIEQLLHAVEKQAESIRDGILAAVEAFSEGEATDDKTLLILKFHQEGSAGTVSAEPVV